VELIEHIKIMEASIILICSNNSTFLRCVHWLDNKVIDIIDARL